MSPYNINININIEHRVSLYTLLLPSFTHSAACIVLGYAYPGAIIYYPISDALVEDRL